MKKKVSFLICLFLLLYSPVFASFKSAESYVRKLVDSKKGRMDIGVGFKHIESGNAFFINPDAKYPLASVFKLPLMIAVLKSVDEGKMTLKDSVTLETSDFCIGSGDLQYASPGNSYSVSHLLYEMIAVSDNTAADALWNEIGYGTCGALLKNNGILNSDVYIANRPSWLLSLAQYGEFKDFDGFKIAKVWKAMNYEERMKAIEKVLFENRNLTIREFQEIEDSSAFRQKAGGYKSDVVVAEALDNLGSPKDFVSILDLLYNRKLLSDQMTVKALWYLSKVKFNSRIPGKLPRNVKVWHKTGTITGSVNDAGIIEFSPKSHGVLVVFVRNISEGCQAEASDAISDIAFRLYESYSTNL